MLEHITTDNMVDSLFEFEVMKSHSSPNLTIPGGGHIKHAEVQSVVLYNSPRAGKSVAQSLGNKIHLPALMGVM